MCWSGRYRVVVVLVWWWWWGGGCVSEMVLFTLRNILKLYLDTDNSPIKPENEKWAVCPCLYTNMHDSAADFQCFTFTILLELMYEATVTLSDSCICFTLNIEVKGRAVTECII